jgi:hypothetical protein
MTISSAGQSIKFTYLGYNSWQNYEGQRNMYYGGGYEQNVTDRISVSLDYNSGYTLDEDKWSSVTFTDGTYGYSFDYIVTAPWQELAYTSKFFFTENDDRSWYISSGIAYRTTTVDVQVLPNYFDPVYASVGQEIGMGINKKRQSLFPITMRIGGRGSIDSWFGDYFIGLTFVPGASGAGTGNKTLDNAIGKKYFRTLSVSIGIALGIGWSE